MVTRVPPYLPGIFRPLIVCWGVLQPIELYNLKSDLGETRNLAKEHPEILSKLERFMDEAHTPLGQVKQRGGIK